MTSIIIIILAIIVGTLIYSFDKKKGIKWYRSWYNISHKDPMPQNVHKGFIINQVFSKKLTLAIIITVIQFLISYKIGGEFLLGIVNSIVFLVGIMIAFYLAPKLLGKIPKNLGNAINYIDQLEEGNMEDNEKLKKAIDSSKKSVIDLTQKTVEENNSSTTKKQNEIPSDNKDKKDDDWRGGVKDFLNK